MEKATRPHASKLFRARPQHAARPHTGVIRRGLPWALMVNSRIVSRCPCESRCMHWLRAYHVFLQNLPWEQSLRASFKTIYKLESAAETKHFKPLEFRPALPSLMYKQGVIYWLLIMCILSEVEHSLEKGKEILRLHFFSPPLPSDWTTSNENTSSSPNLLRK